MRSVRIGLLLVLISTIASAYLSSAAPPDAETSPEPKVLETPPSKSTPTESSDDSHSQLPQHAPGEVIGVPMFA
jgi:hypothetical protein